MLMDMLAALQIIILILTELVTFKLDLTVQ